MTRPGWKTSEFWLSLLATLVGALIAAGIVSEGSTGDRVLGAIVVVLASQGYTVQRTRAKAPRREPERGAIAGRVLFWLACAALGGLIGLTLACAPTKMAARATTGAVVDCTLVEIGAHGDELEAAIRDATNLDGSINWSAVRETVRQLGVDVGGCALRLAIEELLAPRVGVAAQPAPSGEALRAGWEAMRVEVLGGRRYLWAVP